MGASQADAPPLVKGHFDHPGLWLMRHVAALAPGGCAYVCAQASNSIRHRREVFFERNIPAEDIQNAWAKWLFAMLASINTHPHHQANIYLGMNPRPSVRLRTAREVAPAMVRTVGLDMELLLKPGQTKYHHLQMKLQLWKDYGLQPSIIIDYEHGIAATWLLGTEILPDPGGRLTEMVNVMSGAASARRQQLTTRYSVPMPGFLHHRASGKPGTTTILEPSEWRDNPPLQSYAPSALEAFPPSRTTDVRRFFDYAKKMPGELQENLHIIAGQTAAERRRQIQATFGAALATEMATPHKSKNERSLVPRPHDLPFLHYFLALRRYVLQGWDSLPQMIRDKIAAKLYMPKLRPIDVDTEVIRRLRKGYSRAGIIEWAKRQDVNCFPDPPDAYILKICETVDRDAEARRLAVIHDRKKSRFKGHGYFAQKALAEKKLPQNPGAS